MEPLRFGSRSELWAIILVILVSQEILCMGDAFLSISPSAEKYAGSSYRRFVHGRRSGSVLLRTCPPPAPAYLKAGTMHAPDMLPSHEDHEGSPVHIG